MKKYSFTATLIYLFCLAGALWLAVSFTGWGNTPESILAVSTLKKMTFSGYPIPTMLTALSGILPFGSHEFAMSVFNAVLIALTLVMIFTTTAELAADATIGVCAVVCFAAFQTTTVTLRSIVPAAWTILFIVLIFSAAMNYFKSKDFRSILLLCFVSGAALFHSGFLFVLGLASSCRLIADCFSRRKNIFFIFTG
ncbi:MAG TPA: hypothetical protein PLQ76_08635 [bacterium]|nr:hypothetical protein [bacterium]